MRKKNLQAKINYLETKVELYQAEIRQANLGRLRAVEAADEKQGIIESLFTQNNDFIKQIADLQDENKTLRLRNKKLTNDAIENQKVIKHYKNLTLGAENLKSLKF